MNTYFYRGCNNKVFAESYKGYEKIVYENVFCFFRRQPEKVSRSSTVCHTRHLLPEVVPMQDLSYETHSLNHRLDGVDVVDTRSSSQPQLLKRNVSLLSFQFRNI